MDLSELNGRSLKLKFHWTDASIANVCILIYSSWVAGQVYVLQIDIFKQNFSNKSLNFTVENQITRWNPEMANWWNNFLISFKMKNSYNSPCDCQFILFHNYPPQLLIISPLSPTLAFSYTLPYINGLSSWGDLRVCIPLLSRKQSKRTMDLGRTIG